MDFTPAAIFDMDGVLIDSYHAHYRSWLEIAAAVGKYFSESDFAAAFGRTSREIIAHFWGEGVCDDACTAAMDARKEAAFRRLLEHDFPAMPGARELLESLAADGFRLGLGSSGPPENVALVLEKLAVRKLFSAVVTGADVTRGKPDPQVFLLTAERLSVQPAHCVVIEDAPAGLTAARRAGMCCIGLASTGRTRDDLAAADLVADSLHELSPALLRRLLIQKAEGKK